ncbi:putative ankyrin repeat protein RF_0381 [Belonocnema kinseyi]|uniref:putative ankyrin repeat protein RF_0381 n=1 Tax=Belonocnema kinseyi TaxID=2817044 RepID=UPI00143D3B4C|nr:putative ankyrin repeat protein RF_0381 [Belonocnema kinseyi]
MAVKSEKIRAKSRGLPPPFGQAVYNIVKNSYKLYNSDPVLKCILYNLNNYFLSQFGMISIHYAVSQTTSVPLLELLILLGADFNCQNNRGETPLHVAVRKENLTFVKMLLRIGADTNIHNKRGATPLQEALMQKDTDMVKLLASKGSDDILFADDDDLIKFLRSKENKVNISGSNFSTLLYFTARFNMEDAFSQVLAGSSAFDVNAKDPYDTSLLSYLIQMRKENMIKCLIVHGVDLNAEDPYGNTPLMLACKIAKESIAIRLASESVRILKMLAAEITRMKCQGEVVSSKNVEALNHEVLGGFSAECQIEFRRLREKKVVCGKRTRLSRFLKYNVKKLRPVVRSQDKIEISCSVRSEEFPIYADRLIQNIGQVNSKIATVRV